MNKTLFLLCGAPGSGKSTWVREQITNAKYNMSWISRDMIRFNLIKDDEDYFAHEDQVFDMFCNGINTALTRDNIVFADATHLTERARNKTLDRLNLEGVDIIPVNFNLPLETCLAQNEMRKDEGLSYVPRSAIRKMWNSYVPPHDGEKYKYKDILTIGLPYGEEY